MVATEEQRVAESSLPVRSPARTTASPRCPSSTRPDGPVRCRFGSQHLLELFPPCIPTHVEDRAMRNPLVAAGPRSDGCPVAGNSLPFHESSVLWSHVPQPGWLGCISAGCRSPNWLLETATCSTHLLLARGATFDFSCCRGPTPGRALRGVDDPGYPVWTFLLVHGGVVSRSPQPSVARGRVDQEMDRPP